MTVNLSAPAFRERRPSCTCGSASPRVIGSRNHLRWWVFSRGPGSPSRARGGPGPRAALTTSTCSRSSRSSGRSREAPPGTPEPPQLRHKSTPHKTEEPDLLEPPEALTDGVPRPGVRSRRTPRPRFRRRGLVLNFNGAPPSRAVRRKKPFS